MSVCPDLVRLARTVAGHNLGLARPLSQAKSAALVHVLPRTWRNWESGRNQAPLGLFELYLIKTGQLNPSLADSEAVSGDKTKTQYPSLPDALGALKRLRIAQTDPTTKNQRLTGASENESHSGPKTETMLYRHRDFLKFCYIGPAIF